MGSILAGGAIIKNPYIAVMYGFIFIHLSIISEL